MTEAEKIRVREYKREYARRRREVDPEFRVSAAAASARWRLRHPDKVKEQRKFYWTTYPDRVRKFNRDWLSVPANRMSVLVRSRIWNAKKKGIPYSEDALATAVLHPPTHCACCHQELDFVLGAGKKPRGPTIDRVNNAAGYIEGNIAIICFRCNSMKGSATSEEHRMFAEFIERYAKTRVE